MGTIKDITDLTIDLINSTQDRKLTTKITAIQSLISTLQSEQSATIEKNVQLMTINLDLEKKIFELEKEISQLKQVQTGEMSNLRNKYEKQILALEEKLAAKKLQDGYDFIKELGIYKSKESGHYFCSSCLMKNIESPLTTKQNGWRCELKGCGKFYSNPSYQPPQQEKYDPFENL